MNKNTELGLRPTGNRIVVQRTPPETKSKGGILLPEAAMERPGEGTVLAVGPKVVEPAVGDKILFSKYAGTDMAIGGREFVLMNAADVQCVIGK